MDVAVSVDALHRDADLAGVGEAAEDDGAGGALELGVGAGDERGLAAEPITQGMRRSPQAAATRLPVETPPVKTRNWMPLSISAAPVGP